ncbi:YidB family protein [Belnapia sp. F-4-1]|uniref:YidB family protein n=1 Tax=Belnapia sp. F-4-1 TaxID=1545443 RepID=UPI00068D2C82|nr:YidB family protein [Belnapia sp. F-4-1]
MSEFLSRLGGAALNDLKGTPLDAILNRLMGGQAGASGLEALVERLRSGGLAEQVASWVGTGPNRPVSPPELERALGESETGAIAREANLERPNLLEMLSQALPRLVDALTPNGELPRGEEGATALPGAGNLTAGMHKPGIGAGGEAGIGRFGPAPADDGTAPASGQASPPLHKG